VPPLIRPAGREHPVEPALEHGGHAVPPHREHEHQRVAAFRPLLLDDDIFGHRFAFELRDIGKPENRIELSR
jgi:hypothetical protein